MSATIRLFNRAFTSLNPIMFSDVNKLAVKTGYLVHPYCCTPEVVNFLRKQKVNYNATFYSTWNDITSANRFELYIDQILHYINSAYIPNTQTASIPEFKDLKVILPITREEANKKACEMLYSGIALSTTTLTDIIEIVTDIEIDKVKNREAKMYLHKKFNTVPTDAVEFVRYLVFLATDKALLIKDSDTLLALEHSEINLAELVSKIGIDKLSEVFFRFKRIFLSLKKNNKEVVNQLRRLATKNHKPMKKGFFENILLDTSLLPQLPEQLEKCSNFKKVLLLQTILVRQKELDMRFFGIRNGKLWVKKEQSVNRNHYKVVYDIIYKSLVKSLSKRATSVKLPEDIKITLPTSEKSFVGNYPIGTSFELSDTNAIIGINWKGVDGADDLDLSLIDINGHKIGWNSEYTNNNKTILYSGDMTVANPEATELLYAKKGFENGAIINVNLYKGLPNSKFKMFLATENIKDLECNYMVDPNNIRFTVDCVMDSKQKSLAVITGENVILAQFRTGNARSSKYDIVTKYAEHTIKTLDCYLNLEQVLIDSGFTINSGNEEIDLTSLSKDSLISLLQP